MVARVGSWWFVVSDVSSWCPRGGSCWLVVVRGVGCFLVVARGGSWWFVVLEVSSVVARGGSWCRRCPRGVLVVARGVGGVLRVGSWCRRCPRGVLVVARGGSWWFVVSEVSSVVARGGSWCRRCPRGVLVVARVGSWCRRCPPWHICSRSPRRAHARLLSAAALSLVNRSCRARLMDMIALIINYLGAPLGVAFIGW